MRNRRSQCPGEVHRHPAPDTRITRIGIGSFWKTPSDCVLGLIIAVGDGADGAAHHAFGIFHGATHVAHELACTIALGQFEDPPAAQFIGGKLGLDIAPSGLGSAEVGMHDVMKAAIDPEITLQGQLHCGEAQTLLVELLGVECQPGGTASDIDVMGDRTGKSQQRLAMKDRRENRDILKMLAADIGIVGQEHLARPDGAMLGKAGPHGQRERAHLHGNVLSLGNDATFGIEQRAGTVAGLADNGRAGGRSRLMPISSAIAWKALTRDVSVTMSEASCRFIGSPRTEFSRSTS